MVKINFVLILIYLVSLLSFPYKIPYTQELVWISGLAFVILNIAVIIDRIHLAYVRHSTFSKAFVSVNEAFTLCLRESPNDILSPEVKLASRDILREGVLPVQKYTQRDLVELVEYADARIEDIRSAAIYFTQLLSEIREARNERYLR